MLSSQYTKHLLQTQLHLKYWITNCMRMRKMTPLTSMSNLSKISINLTTNTHNCFILSSSIQCFCLHLGQSTRGSIPLSPADEEAIDLLAMVPSGREEAPAATSYSCLLQPPTPELPAPTSYSCRW